MICHLMLMYKMYFAADVLMDSFMISVIGNVIFRDIPEQMCSFLKCSRSVYSSMCIYRV